ncbi:DUF934 domain-containing protein [Natronospirillum operosum]|uniref:DUF934 domain-containing protein n=1 Tax=Natronospirillum operosum TaxID=2759953 RepID=A0A4Z0WKT2_9GAMM|nr:DUF934 domain-containing protein [Natronospirillum operosum]TGG95845.1 DUF934 domain-containing protein [Natronospirillum operosum]
MPELIVNREVVADTFSYLTVEDAVPATGDVIVPLAVWQDQADSLLARGGRTGVWLASDQLAEDLDERVHQADVVAIEFPKFVDGRGFSTAYLLRNRLNYQGELRAIGDILLDQLFYLQRVGFNAFLLPDGKPAAKGLELLEPISVRYQASTDTPSPLFRQLESA